MGPDVVNQTNLMRFRQSFLNSNLRTVQDIEWDARATQVRLLDEAKATLKNLQGKGRGRGRGAKSMDKATGQGANARFTAPLSIEQAEQAVKNHSVGLGRRCLSVSRVVVPSRAHRCQVTSQGDILRICVRNDQPWHSKVIYP